ncbi:MAG: hypothetical protein H7Y16_05385 [Candidatus Parcubacteria bacterium]|nr:hypothetical protein [Burkholderiales bacterium]
MRVLLVALCSLLAAGCATTGAPFREHLASDAPQVRECADWYRQLDERIDAAGARDAQDARVPGFPYLRVNRLLSSMRHAAASNEQLLHALADRMLALDLEARRYEIMNLPAGQMPSLRDALQRTQQCGRLLRGLDLASPGSRAALLRRASKPDDYRLSSRILGAYWLTRIPFAQGVQREEARARAAFGRELRTPEGAILVRHAPEPGASLPRARAALLLERAAGNPLGIPEPSASDLQALLAAYAPSFEIEVKGDYDRFGALRWLRDATVPAVDGAQLAVYGHAAWTRYEGQVLLQLVYTLWFPERPPQSGGDLLAGKLDGITWRVTIAPDGEPLIYDAIHPCGCYHLFFPTVRAQARPVPGGADSLEEWMFAPQHLPRVAEGERPLVRIATGTHAIERVSLTSGSDSLVRYELRPYDELRSLFRFSGPRASVFGAHGLVAGTERDERYFFWPMGIASAGATRQWGRQATAFVGRRHFDDADLFEKRFRFDLR